MEERQQWQLKSKNNWHDPHMQYGQNKTPSLVRYEMPAVLCGISDIRKPFAKTPGVTFDIYRKAWAWPGESAGVRGPIKGETQLSEAEWPYLFHSKERRAMYGTH